jgi:spore coat protein CotH
MMKRLICYLSLGFVLVVAPLPADESRDQPAPGNTTTTTGFEPGTVHKIRLRLTDKEFLAMQPISSRGGFLGFGSPPKPPPAEPGQPEREVHLNTFGMQLPWATGSVAVGDQTFDNVGIRYKGNGTIADAARSIKKSFKIDLEHFGGKHKWLGRKTLNLHSGVSDPTKCRETLGYQIYRAAGVAAPRTAFAEVWLDVSGKHDNEYLGLFTLVEQPDKQFLKDNFGSDKGLLMKPEGVRDFVDQGDDWKRYDKRYEPKREPREEEAARMIAFARLVSKADDEEFRRQIRDYLEIDVYLRFLAVTTFIANSDSFFSLGHNYYMYLHPDTGRLHFFAWDLDRAFANLPIFGSKGQQMNFSLTHPYSGSHRLTERLLAMPGVGEQYQKLFRELSTTVLAREKLLAEISRLTESTNELVERDAQAATARNDRSSGFGPFQMMAKPPDLATFVEKRTKSVAAQLSGTSSGFIPTGGFGAGGFKMGDQLAGPVLEMLDADKNDLLSRTEWLTLPEQVLAACTPDADNQVTETVLAAGINSMFPKPPEQSQERNAPGAFSLGAMMAGPIFKRADTDKDGHLTRAEIVAAAEKLYEEFDPRKTGQLDETQLGKLLTTLFPANNFGRPPRQPSQSEESETK